MAPAKATTLRSQDVRLMLVGVDHETMRAFENSGALALLGAENVLPATDEVLGDLEQALAEPTAWVAVRQRDGTGESASEPGASASAP